MIYHRLDNNRCMYTSLVTIDTCIIISLFLSVLDTHFLLVIIILYCLCLNYLLLCAFDKGLLPLFGYRPFKTISILWTPLSCETIKAHCKLFTSSITLYRTLAKIRPPFSARSLGLLGDWAFNRERRFFIRIYAHPRPQIEVYTLLYDNFHFNT